MKFLKRPWVLAFDDVTPTYKSDNIFTRLPLELQLSIFDYLDFDSVLDAQDGLGCKPYTQDCRRRKSSFYKEMDALLAQPNDIYGRFASEGVQAANRFYNPAGF